ncbi:MAG: ATP-binding protein [Gammaproteobacteria bacterium]|nr:ATP-binding protein [Gammaproteobacteria bacterium]
MAVDNAGQSVSSNKTFRLIVWRTLRWLSVYRILLAMVFMAIPFVFDSLSFFGSQNSSFFSFITVLYFLAALGSLAAAIFQKPSLTSQIDAFIFVDIFVILLCMHVTGGVESNVAFLLIVAVASGAMLSGGRIAFAFPAVASFLVLGEQTYRVISKTGSIDYYAQAGLLGIALFVTAFIANMLTRQLKYSNMLALQRGIDLQNLSKLNEYIIQHMESGVVVADERNRIRLVNESARYLLGLPGHAIMQPLSEISEELVEQLNGWRVNPRKESKTFRVTGSVAIFPRFSEMSMSDYDGVLILLEDTSMLDQQAQTMKMTAMGRLTASIAHEIRNPLGAISHAGQLLEESPNLDKADKRLTQIIREQSVRMNVIIENVMQLSRRDQALAEDIHLKPWLSEFMSDFMKSQGVTDADVGLYVASDDVVVQFDPSHLSQILVNLCQNALRHGHSGGNRKMLEVRVGDQGDAREIILDVIDNGSGIDPETSRQIFEPFFTTASKGTGLGLYIARELAEANQAHLDYIPVPTGGSCFRISFARDKRR